MEAVQLARAKVHSDVNYSSVAHVLDSPSSAKDEVQIKDKNIRGSRVVNCLAALMTVIAKRGLDRYSILYWATPACQFAFETPQRALPSTEKIIQLPTGEEFGELVTWSSKRNLVKLSTEAATTQDLWGKLPQRGLQSGPDAFR